MYELYISFCNRDALTVDLPEDYDFNLDMETGYTHFVDTRGNEYSVNFREVNYTVIGKHKDANYIQQDSRNNLRGPAGNTATCQDVRDVSFIGVPCS